MSSTEKQSEEELRAEIREQVYNQEPRIDPEKAKETVNKKVEQYREEGLIEDE